MKVEKMELNTRLENMMMELLKRKNVSEWNEFLKWRYEVKAEQKRQSDELEAKLCEQRKREKEERTRQQIQDSTVFFGWVGVFTLLYHYL